MQRMGKSHLEKNPADQVNRSVYVVPAKLDFFFFFATQDFNPTWGFSNFSIIIECYQVFKCDELNTLGNSLTRDSIELF